MRNLPTEISNVAYNAAEQMFEAIVTVHDGGAVHRYACAIDAPISMSYARAADGLARQALRKHGAPRGLRSWFAQPATAQVARNTRAALRRGLPLGQYGYFRGRAA